MISSPRWKAGSGGDLSRRHSSRSAHPFGRGRSIFVGPTTQYLTLFVDLVFDERWSFKIRRILNLPHGTANRFRTGAKRIFLQISRLPTLRIFARLQPQLKKIWLLPMILFPILCTACSPLPAAVAIETSCTVTDGDTIRCGDERIRLLGIDAPEKPGHCRRGRQCAPGDPFASTGSLQKAFGNGPLSIIRLGQDHYGRTLALVRAGETDLSCHQLAGGQAIYVERWDDERAVARTCPDLVRN